MQKLNIISNVETWLDARDIRNKIAHYYLKQGLEELYNIIKDNYLEEFRFVVANLKKLSEKLDKNQ